MEPAPRLDLKDKTFLLGVGGMKCATSWTFDYLAGLGGVAVTPLKELHFFTARQRAPGVRPFTPELAAMVRGYLDQAPDVAAELAANAQFRAGVDALQMLYDPNAYLDHFARIAGPETRVLAECTPQYALLGPEGFTQVRAYFAQAGLPLKLVFVMRDPVARLWSHLRSLPRGDKGLLEELPTRVRAPEVLARSDYIRTVQALDAVFPAEDVLFLFYEDLFDSAALPRLCRFLDVRYVPADTATRQNATPDQTPLPGTVRAGVGKLLAPQYRFCRARFGAAVPRSWGAES